MCRHADEKWLTAILLFYQGAVHGSTWLLSSMVREVLSTMAEETSDDALTLSKRSSDDLTPIADKPESESCCFRLGLG